MESSLIGMMEFIGYLKAFAVTYLEPGFQITKASGPGLFNPGIVLRSIYKNHEHAQLC